MEIITRVLSDQRGFRAQRGSQSSTLRESSAAQGTLPLIMV
jgi:hypothetical protein